MFPLSPTAPSKPSLKPKFVISMGVGIPQANRREARKLGLLRKQEFRN